MTVAERRAEAATTGREVGRARMTLVTVDERGYYNISDAAALLGVSRVTVWRWIRDGRLPASRLGHRTIRIRREDLDRLPAQIAPAGAISAVARNPQSRAEADDSATSGRAPRSAWTESRDTEHVVQLYETDAVLLDALADFIGTAIRAGDAGIVIATPAHRDGLDERLRARKLDVAAARSDGRYVPLDAAETLSRFMADGAPDRARFAEAVGEIVAHAAAGGRRVSAFGEMVALLAADGNLDAALRVERLWNDLRQIHDFSLLCAYPMDRLGGETLAGFVDSACAAHSRVIPAESYTALPTADERLRAVAALQQKARWLEAEIWQRERAEERLRVALASERAARQEAEAASRLRDEFLSIAAHELRTPIAGLMGRAQLLLRQLRRDGRLEPERAARGLEGIAGQADKLSRLLNHLLDVSRLDACKLTLERQPTDLAALLQQVVADARVANDLHSITLAVPGPVAAQVDPLRLEQVLANLLDNAIKFSPDGSPIEVVLSQPDGAAVELSVRDRGIGIPPEKRDRMFERFCQAHADGPNLGLGLGLYISRQIVELHGGEIGAEFPPDGGTRFVVRLPVAPAEAHPDG